MNLFNSTQLSELTTLLRNAILKTSSTSTSRTTVATTENGAVITFASGAQASIEQAPQYQSQEKNLLNR